MQPSSDAINHDFDLVSKLPPELLGEIFSYTSLLDADAPLRVGEVSTLFRRTVRATPQAWGHLVLSLAFARLNSLQDVASVEDADARAIRKAELWFSMSKVILVDVTVELSSVQVSGKDAARKHTHILLPIRRHDSYPRPDNTTKVHGYGQELPDVHLELTELLLPQVLCNFNQRIRTLDLHSRTVNEAQAFIAAVYPPTASSTPFAAGEEYPLKSLTLHASSDGSGHVPHRHRNDLRTPSRTSTLSSQGACSSPTSSTGVLLLPFLPRLTCLSFYNHLLPPLASNNLNNLRLLQVHYPLRFSPIPISMLLEVFGEARRLERVEIEARVALDTGSRSNPNPSSSSHSAAASLALQQPPNHPSNPVALPSVHSASLSPLTPSQQSSLIPDLSSPAAEATSSHHQLPFLSLPRLTYLHLRINNLPSVLSQLLLPSLRTLSIDDLDGKRSGAAKQMGEVLRGLLVRMEMPFDGDEEEEEERCKAKGTKRTDTEMTRGLEVLDMCSVALPLSHGHDDCDRGLILGSEHRHIHDPATMADTDAQAAEAVWVWCFKRMRALHELRTKKMAVDALFGLITPRTRTRRTRVGGSISDGQEQEQEQGEHDQDDIPLPALKKLVITEQDVYHPHSSSGLHRMSAHGHGYGVDMVSFGFSSSFDIPNFSSTTSNHSHLSSPVMQREHPYPHPHRGPLVKFQLRRSDVQVIYDALLDPMSVAPFVHVSPASPSTGVDFFDLYSG